MNINTADKLTYKQLLMLPAVFFLSDGCVSTGRKDFGFITRRNRVRILPSLLLDVDMFLGS
jgi:hypothetical protein